MSSSLIVAAETALTLIRMAVLHFNSLLQALRAQGLSNAELLEKVAALKKAALSALAELPTVHAAQLKDLDP